MSTKKIEVHLSGKSYADSRVGKRGQRDMPNEYEHDAIRDAFDAGRKSREPVLHSAMIVAAKLALCEGGEKYGCGITNGEVWRLLNAIHMDEGRAPVEPNKAHPCLPEPVYTHSEVRAILHDMRSWISPDDGEEGRMWETRAKSHGIVLDPA